MVSRRRLPLVYGILIMSGFIGAWLAGLFDGDEIPKEISGLDLLLGVVGLFIFVGSIIVFFYLVGRYRHPMSEAEAVAWKDVRENGKTSYIRLVLIEGFLMGGVSSSFAVFYSSGGTGFSRVGLFIGVFSIITFGFYYAALRFWKSNEEDYEALHTEGQHNKRLQPTPR